MALMEGLQTANSKINEKYGIIKERNGKNSSMTTDVDKATVKATSKRVFTENPP